MRLPGLDGIRAVSVAFVVAFHITETAGIWRFPAGAFGVRIFFVISGFLITWLLCSEEKQNGTISLKGFYARRALRILPPAFAYLAVVIVLARMALVTTGLRDIAGCLLFVRNTFIGDHATTHFWSLSLEEQFYFLWPAAFFLLATNSARLKFAAIVALIEPVWRAFYFRFAGVTDDATTVRFDLCSDALMIGCCLALLRSDDRFARYLKGRLLQSHWLPVVAVGILALQVPSGRFPTMEYVLVALVINYAVDQPRGWGYMLNWKPLVWLGKLSYSLYIWQQLFCWMSPFGTLGRFPYNVVASLTAASLSYYVIEQPATRLRKRIRFAPTTRLFAKRPVEPALDLSEP